MAQINNLAVTGASRFVQNMNVNGNIITPANNSYGIRPAIGDYGYVGTSSYYYYHGYITLMYASTIYPKSSSISVAGNLVPDSNNSRELGGSSSYQWKNIYGVSTSATTTASTNTQAGTGWTEITGGKRHIYLKVNTSSIAISSTYGNLKFITCEIKFPSSLGFSVSKNGMVVGLSVQYGTGLNFCSLNALTDTSLAFYLSCAQAESAKQYTVYAHLVCDY